MADNRNSPTKSPVTNPYLKKATPERQTVPYSPPPSVTICKTSDNTNPETPEPSETTNNSYRKNITPATDDAKPVYNNASPSDKNSNVKPANTAAAPVATVAASPSKLTPAQQLKIQENRKRALERRVVSLEKQEPRKKARLQSMQTANHRECSRCGSVDSDSLCIVWNHEGEIQRERSYTGWDNFRWTCCGRLSPAPCFVGRHTFSSLHGVMGNYSSIITVSCNCHNGPAKLLCTRKDTPNCGRYFFKCSGSGIDKCDFFLWADKAFNLKYRRCLPAPDGVKEWIHIYANPFDQDYHWMESTASMVSNKPIPLLRMRLVAALLMHQCCTSVTGGWSVANPKLEDFVTKVQDIFQSSNDLQERKTLLLKGLYPLSQDQITARFGVTFQEENDPLFDEVLTVKECREAVSRATQENSVLRSCGVKIKSFAHPNNGMSEVYYLPLEGLENYLAS